jgi:hypothetical protein
LLGQWIVALVLDMERDWTWDGLAQPAALGQPTQPQLSFARDSENIGTVTVPRVVAAGATGNPGQTTDRSRTRIIFFDSIDPNPLPGDFPDVLNPVYRVTANFGDATPQQVSLPITLPITTPPSQTPKIVSTGIAESPYTHSLRASSRTVPIRCLPPTCCPSRWPPRCCPRPPSRFCPSTPNRSARFFPANRRITPAWTP